MGGFSFPDYSYQPDQLSPLRRRSAIDWLPDGPPDDGRVRIAPLDRLPSPPKPEVPEPSPRTSFANGMLPSPGMLGDWIGSAAKYVGGGGVGNYSLPASISERVGTHGPKDPPPTLAGHRIGSPMGAPNVGPQQSPDDILGAANERLETALRPTLPDNSIEGLKKRLGFSWGKGAQSPRLTSQSEYDATAGSWPSDVERTPLSAINAVIAGGGLGGPNERPAIDSVVHDPISGKAVQAHESTGGGGYGPSAHIDLENPDASDIPFEQWPESQQKALYDRYDRKKKQADAEDPNGLRLFGAKKAIEMDAGYQGRQRGAMADVAELRRIDDVIASDLARIEQLPVPEEKKRELREAVTERGNTDKRNYLQAQALSRSGSVPSDLFKQPGFGG